MDSTSMSFGNALSSLQLGSNHGGTINFNSPGQSEAPQQDKDNVVLKSLAFPQMLDRRDNIERCHANTCEWILEMEDYKTWMSSCHGLLWVKGKPGAGKSTLMAFLYDKLEKCRGNDRRGGIQLDFFFTARGSELQRAPLGMFRSLLNQIYASDDTVRCAVREAYEKRCRLFGHNDEHKWPQKTLEELLTGAILTSASQQQVRVFVDALDETGAESAQQLAAYFHRLSTRARKENKSASKIIIGGDIATYIDDVLADMEEEEDITPDLKGELMKQLTERANGVFQWAHIMVPLLQQRVLDGNSLDDRKMPKYPPPTKTWENIEGFVDSDKRMKRKIKALSGGLVEVVPGELEFKDSPWGFEGNLESCLVYLATANTPRKLTKNKLIQSYPFLPYATKNLFIHAEKSADSRIEVLQNEIDTLQRLFDRWLSIHRCFGEEVTSQDTFPPLGTKLSHVAALYNLVDVIEWLASNSEDLRSEDLDGNTAFHFAARRGHIAVAKILRQNGADCGAENTKSGKTPLIEAAENGNLEFVEWLLNGGVDIDQAAHDEGNALQAASENAHHAVVAMLLEAGADVNAQGGLYGNALQAATYCGNIEAVQLLLDAGADVNSQGGKFGNALQAAAGQGNIKVVQLLLDASANVNAQSGKYGNALQAAARYGRIKVVQLLLDVGADVNAQGGRYGNALQAAAGQGNIKVVQLLLDASANINAQGGKYGNALQASAFDGDIKVVELLLDAHADVNSQCVTYASALQIASFYGDIEIVQILLDAHADVNAQGGRYGNALQAAKRTGQTMIVQRLLDAGAHDISMVESMESD
ncbi:hypothetical protein N7481_010484 [Penicillium waksmanii]|uniref:uncharacterized protein n=1 Tax=Penicillium waksmanii TaxID=69791 RepID=UPI002546F473|nr:uncharacterized protein N7481_010484 [Penicillium waksmanii]KAJ5973274.1 hypothetical protein N7481_010484 [Penicillium waksmanii]